MLEDSCIHLKTLIVRFHCDSCTPLFPASKLAVKFIIIPIFNRMLSTYRNRTLDVFFPASIRYSKRLVSCGDRSTKGINATIENVWNLAVSVQWAGWSGCIWIQQGLLIFNADAFAEHYPDIPSQHPQGILSQQKNIPHRMPRRHMTIIHLCFQHSLCVVHRAAFVSPSFRKISVAFLRWRSPWTSCDEQIIGTPEETHVLIALETRLLRGS